MREETVPSKIKEREEEEEEVSRKYDDGHRDKESGGDL